MLRVCARTLSLTLVLGLFSMPAAAQGLKPKPGPSRTHTPMGGAASSSAVEFLGLCRSPSQRTRAACSQVLLGLMQVHIMIGQRRRDMRLSCPPREVQAEQARNMFAIWAKKHPEIGSMDISEAVNRALSDTYPCSKWLK